MCFSIRAVPHGAAPKLPDSGRGRKEGTEGRPRRMQASLPISEYFPPAPLGEGARGNDFSSDESGFIMAHFFSRHNREAQQSGTSHSDRYAPVPVAGSRDGRSWRVPRGSAHGGCGRSPHMTQMASTQSASFSLRTRGPEGADRLRHKSMLSSLGSQRT